MKQKTKRFTFVFDEETDGLIREMADKTGLKFVTVVQQAVILLAKEKGLK